MPASAGSTSRTTSRKPGRSISHSGPCSPALPPTASGASSDLLVRDGQAIVAATPDETDPARARYSPDVAAHWHYEGAVATQYWQARARHGLVVRVNGRQTYWASRTPIPGGVAYENFELEAPSSPARNSVSA